MAKKNAFDKLAESAKKIEKFANQKTVAPKVVKPNSTVVSKILKDIKDNAQGYQKTAPVKKVAPKKADTVKVNCFEWKQLKGQNTPDFIIAYLENLFNFLDKNEWGEYNIELVASNGKITNSIYVGGGKIKRNEGLAATVYFIMGYIEHHYKAGQTLIVRQSPFRG